MTTTTAPAHTHDDVITADVAILGGGSGAERLAPLLAEAGRQVVLVERHLVGGECPFYACIPSKAMLLTAAIRQDASTAHEIGASAQPLELGDAREAFRRAAERRDRKAADHDDAGHVAELRKAGVRLVRGEGRLDGPGRLLVDTADGTVTITADDLVLATGADVAFPDVPGLRDSQPWTFVEAWTATARPDSLLVLGGGAVGCEIAQVYARYGTAVTLVQRSGLLGSTVDPVLGEDLATALREDGIDVRTGVQATEVRDGAAPTAGRSVVLDDGTTVTAQAIVVATGKRPNTGGIGLEALGLDPQAVEVDTSCRVVGADRLWAIGDVTGQSMFTHTANQHGWVVAQNLLGRPTQAPDGAIPRTTYTQPQVAAVGLTEAQARSAGHDALVTTFDLAETSRGWVSTEFAGHLVLVADRREGVLLGAGMVAPHAGESISEFSLAVHARVPVEVLTEVVHPFPAWADAFGYAIRELADELRAAPEET